MKAQSRHILILLSLSGGLLSGLAWTSWCPGLILLVSFVPFLLIEEQIFRNRERYTPNAFFIFLLPGFLVFNMMGLGWMRVATMAGTVTVLLGMTFLMSFTLWLAHVIRLRAGDAAGAVSFIALWLAFEFATLNISFITPWMNLGNGLAKEIRLIQWYELTGTGGGSLWILASNLFLAAAILKRPERPLKDMLRAAPFIIWICLLIIPAAVSVFRYNTVSTVGSKASEVVIMQPNADPYNEKFRVPFDYQLDKIASDAISFTTPETEWVIMPETVVDDPVNQADTHENLYVRLIRRIALRNPRASVVAGLVTYISYPSSDVPPTRSARPDEESGGYLDYFNSAVKIDTGRTVEFYNKSKLVPGIEMQFSYSLGKVAARILPYLGGTKWGYGIQNDRSVFTNNSAGYKAGTAICYESAFGDFIADFVRNGANAIFIITNDGWWKNTDGYRQHLTFASLRAIETRRPVARSANTGVSCIINNRGDRVRELEWWSEGVIRGKIFPSAVITPYVRHGDWILRIATGVSALVISIVLVLPILRRK